MVIFPEIRIKEEFKNKGTFFQFFGDYIDRGKWSDECFYFLYDLINQPGMTDYISLLIGNHDVSWLTGLGYCYGGKNEEHFRKAVEKLVKEDKLKACNEVNGVFYSHSFLSLEFLFDLYKNYGDKNKDLKDVIEFFVRNIDFYDSVDEIDFDAITKEEFINQTLFALPKYKENLDNLVKEINKLYKQAIVDGIKDSFLFGEQGLVWADINGKGEQNRRFKCNSTPCPNIQMGYGHTVYFDDIPHKIFLIARQGDPSKLDGHCVDVEIKINYNANHKYCEEKWSSLYLDYSGFMVDEYKRVFLRILGFDGGASSGFYESWVSNPSYVRTKSMEGKVDVLEHVCVREKERIDNFNYSDSGNIEYAA
ncbi:metallophosphoesterase [bacterium]|nr:metallophosphoesterase [bacterium]